MIWKQAFSVRPTRGMRTFASVSDSARTRAQAKIAELDSERPFSPALVDTFQRRHDYLRISLTERCNLRCFYCMPEEGIELSPQGKLLTNEEILRLASLFVRSGVTKIRLTGGEPTVRKGVDAIIAGLNTLRPQGLQSIAMTTNGIALPRKLSGLVANGLSHINLSLDTLDPFKFEIMTRRRGHDAVLKSLRSALDNPALVSVKLNVVVIKGLNDAEVVDFVEMTKDAKLSVRFIEFMPFTGNSWDKHKMVPSDELLEHIRTHYQHRVARVSDEVNDTARSWQISGYQGSFGFISSMSDHFCSSCNRLRITADGQIKVCLFDAKEVSLRDIMRQGATDEELLRVIALAVQGKQEKHANMEDIDVVTNRPMILIGDSYVLLGLSYRPRPRRRRLADARPLRMYSTTAVCRDTPKLTHLDAEGRANMVDVTDKDVTQRTATATGRIYIPSIAYQLITNTYPTSSPNSDASKAVEKARRKGDTLTVAQLAAIMGSKRTADLIPLCHPLALTKVNVDLVPESHHDGRYSVVCRATITCTGKTGVEMEALTAVSVGLLTVWDMLKAVAGKDMEIGEIKVVHKAGGKSGDFERT
ncbi:molybdenum cofactor biosynthesis prote [Cylindrobasidium torrendii FP15055 ss-10]|uniref:Molybdenum cofactor biosynthesis prote n=1 Tax=Cylindrobasidium torrendii FP15055 ss-10 TaxID=1314674 RepID=A0A0D7BT22_9AGAR|nr:molybdenum cofactor biosynthesis prote [Cylindrobasidium torrendii FP15055 ss-10]